MSKLLASAAPRKKTATGSFARHAAPDAEMPGVISSSPLIGSIARQPLLLLFRLLGSSDQRGALGANPNRDLARRRRRLRGGSTARRSPPRRPSTPSLSGLRHSRRRIAAKPARPQPAQRKGLASGSDADTCVPELMERTACPHGYYYCVII